MESAKQDDMRELRLWEESASSVGLQEASMVWRVVGLALAKVGTHYCCIWSGEGNQVALALLEVESVCHDCLSARSLGHASMVAGSDREGLGVEICHGCQRLVRL